MFMIVCRRVQALRLWLLLPFVVLGLAAAAPLPAYRAGQVWEYHTRPGDEGSLLKIQKIETDPAYAKVAPIYHVTVIGVHLGGRPGTSEIGHLPVSKQTLDMSVTRLHKGSEKFPSPDRGIAEWRRAKGGVFTMSMAEIVGVMDNMLRSQSGAGAPQKAPATHE